MTVKVRQDSLEWALVHAETYGDTDVFPLPFEFQAIRHGWNNGVLAFLAKQDLDTRSVGLLRRCLSPKGQFSYRAVTQLDPIDFLLYSALIYEIGPDLEKSRVPTNEQIVYSFRFKPSGKGRMFDNKYNWNAFISRCRDCAQMGSYDYVVVTDIADFFPRVYAHRIESAFKIATKKDQARAVLKMLKGWNERVSYGIPIGPAASRLIAEVTLDDVDRCLIATNAFYCRYSDDFRIFCKSKSEAYSRLEFLAETLNENHGLSLQPGKTEIIATSEFELRYLQTPQTLELQRLRESFGEIVEELGLDDPYEELDFDELDDNIKLIVNSMNLDGILDEQLHQNQVDIGIFRFVLRRLGQLNNSVGVEWLFGTSDKYYPAVPQVVSYIKALKSLQKATRLKIGKWFAELLEGSVIAQLPYQRLWLLSAFAESNKWGQESILPELFNKYSDPFTQRKIMLALGRSKQAYWFRRMKKDVLHMGPWTRRAFLAASSCMAPDEHKAWCKSLRPRLDNIETCVIDWVHADPF